MKKSLFITAAITTTLTAATLNPMGAYAFANCTTSGTGTNIANATCTVPKNISNTTGVTSGENVTMRVTCMRKGKGKKGQKSPSYYTVVRTAYITEGFTQTLTAFCNGKDKVSQIVAN